MARGEIVLQDKVCIAIEKEGWLGKGSVSRYNFCIVTEAAGLGWEFVLQYKNCIAIEGQGSWAHWAQQARAQGALGAWQGRAGRR